MNARESHLEQIDRWAEFIRNNPTKWKKIHSEFINAIFEKNEQLIKKLAKTPEGRKKIIELYQIKNLEGYKFLKD
jgi:hypothetical protein